jgi:hypothetical protein
VSTIEKTYSNEKTYRKAVPAAGWFERWARLAGIAFVVLMVVGSMLIGDVPTPDATARDITAYIADGGRHTRNLIGAYLWVLGALAFLWFLVRLRNDIRRAEREMSFLSHLTFGAGVAFAAVWMVSAASFAAVPYAIELRNAPISELDLVRVLPALGRLLLLLGGGFAGLLVILSTSTAIFRTRVFPRWLAWVGVAAAIVLLLDVIYLNIFPFWTWVLIASIVMLRKQRKQPAPAAAY